MQIIRSKRKNTPLILAPALILLAIFALSTFSVYGFAASNPDTPAICLTMIVKNESRIIERCLNSVKDIVDCICICDTGSTDNTVELIEGFLKKNKIPGDVYHHKWKNFGHNRTLSSHAARITLQKLVFPLNMTYLLLLDADMVLINSGFNKSELKYDAYTLVQKNGWLAYDNTRLIRASFPWECIGKTHEYWHCKFTRSIGKLESLSINDIEDGGSKSNKFERDLAFLTKEIEENPMNERVMYYLAQTHLGLQNYNDAINWYKARIEQGGWNEEVWFSKFMIGSIYQAMGFWDYALQWYLKAYQYEPARAEPLQKIAAYYGENAQHHLAYLFAKQGSMIPYPKDHTLNILYNVYNYQFLEELSIAAYHTPFKEEGFEAADQLVLKREIPLDVKNNARKTLLFYVQNIKYDEMKSIDFDSSVLKNIEYPANPKNDECKLAQLCSPNYDFSSFRCSGPPIEFDNGYLSLIHEVVFAPERKYLHRFVYLDRIFNVKKISRPFTFIHQGIEYSYDMSIDHAGKKCKIPVVYEDQKAHLVIVDLETVRAMLKSLP